MRPRRFRQIVVPVCYARGHAEARQIVARISRLVEDRGVTVCLDCPRRQRAFAPPICHVLVTGATAARARWALRRIVMPLLTAAHR